MPDAGRPIARGTFSSGCVPMGGQGMSNTPGTAEGPLTRAVATDTITKAFQDAVCGPDHLGRPEVVWSDGGSRILLHVGKLRAVVAGNALVVAVDTESAELGVAPLIVRFVFGSEGQPGMLVAATDATALGHPQVAARWGGLFRDVIWAAFARLVEVSTAGRTATTGRLTDQGLELTLQPAVHLPDLARHHLADLAARGLRVAAAAPAGGTPGPPPAPSGRRPA